MAVPEKLKIYNKKGNYSYKEKRLIEAIKEAIVKKREADPLFASDFKVAEDWDSLKNLHEKYCSEEVVFQEIKTKSGESTEISNPAEGSNTSEPSPVEPASNAGQLTDPDDPFNAEEPIVRDYVLNDEFAGNKGGAVNPGPTRTTFEEPTTFVDSFSMPDDEPVDNNRTGDNRSTSNANPEKGVGAPPKSNRAEPVNPSFDDMSNGTKKRQTKQFAKYIVEVVCMLSEKGFIWYANKDINDAKLAEYEIDETIDLSVFLTMSDGQQATVRQFFEIKCLQAEQLAVIGKEEKEDLVSALTEVMLEKGIAPTPMQQLGICVLSILGRQAVQLMVLKSETNSVLNQLKERRAEEIAAYEKIRKRVATPPAPPKQETAPVPPPIVEPSQNTATNESADGAPAEVKTEPVISEKKKGKKTEEIKKDELGIITTPAPTIE